MWKFDLADSEALLHHDFKRLPNGNILMIAWDIKTADEALAAGRDPALTHPSQVWGERIIEVRPTGSDGGEIVWEWRLWDHLVQEFDPSKSNHGVVSEHPELIDINHGASVDTSDWIHANSIDYNPELDQIVISSWYFNEIWVIDHSTTTAAAASHQGGRSGRGGDILYRWGNPAAYKMPGEQKLFGQHNAHWIEPGLPGQGHILIFNNRPNEDYSSVEEIETPLNSNGTYRREAGEPYGPSRPVWRNDGNGPAAYQSQFLSGAQRLANGNTLISAGSTGAILEVDGEGQEVWRYDVPSDPDSGGRSFFRAYRYEVSDQAILTKLPRPVSPVVVNAASLAAGPLAPGMLASAFGSNLADTTEAAAQGSPAPTLGGSSVAIIDSAGERWSSGILFASPEQINFQIPQALALGAAQIIFRSRAGTESVVTVELRRESPGLFVADAGGEGPPVGYEVGGNALNSAPILLNDSNSVYLMIAGTGMRHTPGTSYMTARIGGVAVDVVDLSSDVSLPGVDQLLIGPIPRQLSGRAEVPLVLTVGGASANLAVLSFSGTVH